MGCGVGFGIWDLGFGLRRSMDSRRLNMELTDIGIVLQPTEI